MKRVFYFASSVALMVLVSLVMSACGSGVRFVRLDDTVYEPKSKDAVIEIHRGSVMQPHVVIGTLTCEKTMKASFNDKSTYDEVLGALKDYARQIGADALVEVHPVTDDGGLDTRIEVTATAIRFMTAGRSVSSSTS